MTSSPLTTNACTGSGGVGEETEETGNSGGLQVVLPQLLQHHTTETTTTAQDNNNSGSDTIIDSPPRPVRTSSSPRQSSNSSNHNNHNSSPLMIGNNTTSLVPPSPSSSSPRTSAVQPYSRRIASNNTNSNNNNNFRKYGSIRPPISVLQTEFCTMYRLWEEHDAILRRVELKPSSDSVRSRAGGGGGNRMVVLPNNMGNNATGGDDVNDWRKYKPRQVVRSGSGSGSVAGGNSPSNDDDSSNDDDDEEINDKEEWEEAFDHLRTLYSRHHWTFDNPEIQQQQQQHHHQFAATTLGSSYLSVGSSSSNRNEFLESLCAIDDEDTTTLLEEKLEEADEIVIDGNNTEEQVVVSALIAAVDDNSGEETQHLDVDETATTTIAKEKEQQQEVEEQQQQQQQKKRNEMDNLAKLFRPGSKLVGSIETLSQFGLKRGIIDSTTILRDYSLVIMEENECDELGRPKGYLARQTCGSEEQCVFVHVKFVPLSDVMGNLDDGDLNDGMEEEKATDDEEEITLSDDNMDNTSKKVNNKSTLAPPPQSQSPLEVVEDRITIQMEYVDNDKRYWGYWNPNTLSFGGKVQKLGDGNNIQGASDRGGVGGGMRNSASTNNVIMSGLISGRAVGFADGEVSGSDNGGDIDETTTTTLAAAATSSSSQRPKRQLTFSLSPCTHLHPRGRVQSPSLTRVFMPTFLSMMGSDYLSSVDIGLLGGGFGSNNSANNMSEKKKSKVSEQDQLAFMDELASDDNYKFALHRARTEQLLLETVVKLAELGSLVDFAELARKRNVAKRREKWRRRLRKITPKMPRKIKSRRKKKKEAAGEDEFGFPNVEKKKEQFYDQLAAISWDRLLQAASIQAERTCATFRRRSALLDGLTFQSDEYKYQVMSDLRANGMTLSSSHSEWDHCIQMGRTVALGWSWFERGSWGCFERSAVVGKRCVHLLFQMHSRLGVCHEQLEKSFRSADARISIAKLESLKQVSCDDKPNEDDSEELLCGVCQCDIYEEDGEEDEDNKEASIVVTLPCSHSFHWDCIREWLHDHSKCPICRVDLNE